MRFAAPAGLLLGLLAVPVLLLHVLRPRRAPREVGSVLLWRDLARPVSAASPWQRLRPSWLLAAQLLAVALLAVAVAGPERSSPATLASHTVFVIDLSGSMAARDGSPDRLADAVDRARSLHGQLPPGGVASVVAAGDRARVVLASSGDEGAFDAALDALTTTTGAGDLAGAFALAAGLDTGDGAAGVVLLSDGRLTAEERAALPPGTRFERIGARATNRAIARLSLEARGSGLHARLALSSTGGPEATQVVRIDVDGVTASRASVVLRPGAVVDHEVDLPAGSVVTAMLEGEDLLAADDTAWAVAPRRAAVRVLLIGDDLFVGQALAASADVSTTRVTSVPSDAAGWADVDVAVFNGVGVPEDVPVPFLAVATPGGVPGVVAVTGTVEAPVPASVRSDDPLLAGLDLAGVAIAEAQRVSAVGTSVLVAGEEGPLLLRGTLGPLPFVHLAFRLPDSNLPLQVAFPLLVDRIVADLAGSALPPAAIPVGRALPVDAGRTVTVVSPRGNEATVRPGEPAPVADRRGVWTLRSEGRPDVLVAVNAAPSESELAPVAQLPVPARAPVPGQQAPVGWRSVLLVVGALLLVVLALEALLTSRSVAVPRRRARASMVLRALAAAGVLAALVVPSITLRSDRVATVFLLDGSASLGNGGRTDAAAWVREALAGRPDEASAGVVVFGGDARIEQSVRSDPSFDRPTVVVDRDATDVAAALRLAGAVLPSDARRRVVVLSDGRATKGDAAAEAAELRRRGIRVDTVTVGARTGPDAAVASVEVPGRVRVGEAVPVDVAIDATVPGPARVVLERDGEVVATQDVELRAGRQQFRLLDTGATAGGGPLLRYSVRVERDVDVVPENDRVLAAVEVDGPARVLVAEGTAGAGSAIAAALRAAGTTTVVVDAKTLPDVRELASYTATVLVDVDVRWLVPSQIEALATVTRDLGRGLVTVGGPRSYGMGGYRSSPIDDLLPVTSEILDPLRRATVAQVLSIDTSVRWRPATA
jgi:Mg-chelatase subunit ChlD